MNALSFFIFFILIGQAASGEVNIDTSNLYFKALKLHIERIKVLQSSNPNITKIPEILFVEKDVYTTDSLPENIGSYKIKYLTSEEIFMKTKNKKAIYLIAIRPAMWRNGLFKINVIDFGVSRKRNHFHYTNGGGSCFLVTANESSKDLILKNCNN